MDPRVKPGGDGKVSGAAGEKPLMPYYWASLASPASLRSASGCGMATML
jgi:hypothetical protein